MAAANRFLSISGGGWNSHSSVAGLLAGGLDGLSASTGKSDFATLLADVDGISANSGGSWFLSALAYSAPFVAALEQQSGRDNYNTTGYNGQVADLFRGVVSKSPHKFSDYLNQFSPEIAARFKSLSSDISYYERMAKTVGGSELNWRNIVDYFVYKPYGMVSELGAKGLDAARQSWASGKDLLIAAAAQMSPTVLENLGSLTQNKIFSWTSPRVTGMPPQGQVTPLFFTSKASGSAAAPQASALFSGGAVNLNLSTNKIAAVPSSLSTPAAANLATTVSVIDATTASSSAMALLASPQTYGKSLSTKPLRNALSSLMSGMSPLAQIEGGSLSSPRRLPSLGTNAKTEQRMALYNQKGITQLADGGYADNTAGAYMVRHIQDSFSSVEPFALTLIMNSSVDPLTGFKMPTGPGVSDLSSFWVPRDVAKLFGNATGTRNDPSSIPFDGLPMLKPEVPNAKVFDITAWYGEKPEWTYAKGGIEMSYYDLNVKTVENSAFGVKGGQAGQVHLFITNNKNSFAAPVRPTILDEYAANFNVTRDAIVTQGGYRYLQDALGLTS